MPEATVRTECAERRAEGLTGALARLAFGAAPSGALDSVGPRHLAFLPPEALELDLDDPAQRQFGDYELIEKLGQGGMGVVYRARQRSLDREVALKLLSAGPWASRDFIERFRREAQSAARMQHPNIIPVFEIGAQDELNFFSMRLVRGRSLAQMLNETGTLPSRSAAALMRTIAEALDYAHRLGVLHLDLKPGNVMIDERGEPQVADFGLARRLDESLAMDNDEVSGTPSYMAPEQAQIRSHKLSQATDIYGLGAILYELVAGRPPFLGSSPQDTLQRVITTEPTRPRELAPALSADLEAICLKCLSREPGSRYPSARALADDLGRYLDGRPVDARPLRAAQRAARWVAREPRLALAAAIAASALLIGVVGIGLQWRRAETNAVAARATAWSQRRDAVWQDFQKGDWLAAVGRLIDNLREQEAAGADADAARERRALGIVLAASPRLIDVVALDGTIQSVAISPDGGKIAATGRPFAGAMQHGTLHLVDAGSGLPIWSSEIGPETGDGLVHFSTDGSFLHVTVCLESTISGNRACMSRFRSADGKAAGPPAEAGAVEMVSYSGDSSRALIVDKQGLMRLWHSVTWQPISATRQVGNKLALLMSDDGAQIAFRDARRRSRVELLESEGLAPRHVIETGEDPIVAWSFSGDGRTFAFATLLGSVETVATASGERRPMRYGCGSPVNWLQFSEDGAWVAAACHGSTLRVWEIATGAQAVSPLHLESEPELIAMDRATGQLFVQGVGRSQVWRLPQHANERAVATLATPVLLGEGERNYLANAFDPRRGLLVSGTPEGKLKLWRMPPDAMRPAPAPPLSMPDLGFDGEHLVAVSGNEVRIVRASDAGELAPPLEHPQAVAFAALTADGATLVTSSGRELRAWDWRAGRLRSAPIELPGTPLKLALSDDGSRLFASFGEYREDRFVERLRTWRLPDGAPLGDAAPAGPLAGARFSADGKFLVTWRGDEVRRWNADGLAPSGPPIAHRDDEGAMLPVMDARLAEGTVHVTTRRRNTLYPAYYFRWNTRSGERIERTALIGRSHVFALGRGDHVAFYGFQHGAARQFHRRSAGAPLEWMPLPAGTPFGPGLAYSADGSMLAEAPSDGALVIDAASGTVLSPPLRTGLDAYDNVTQLAFSPDATRLLGRTAFGQWLVWNLTPEARTAAALAREHGLRAAETGAGWIDSTSPLDPSARASLRARDAGPPPPRASREDPNLAPPSRDPSSSSEQLNLDAYYTPLVPANLSYEQMFDLRTIPLGRQRFLGIDFDLRGIVQLDAPNAIPIKVGLPERVDGIALPPSVRAVHLLLGAYGGRTELQPVLDVVFHYRDGGERTVPIALRLFKGGWLDDPEDPAQGDDWRKRGARIAWLAGSVDSHSSLAPKRPIHLISAANPEPERELATLSLVAKGAPLVLALTVEPVAAIDARDAGAAARAEPLPPLPRHRSG